MRLLLDTHALIWWLEDSPHLGPVSRALIADADNDVLVSIVSLWEITIKWRVGKLAQSGSHFAELLDDQRIDLLPVTAEHIRALDTLAFHHGDPFDHLILAQAERERLMVVTSDRQMALYGVPCIEAAK
ncbi:type II toxin-antitoxin system VapC family toxin [Sphingopyxis granuli]|jgi:PIN domain nuclease of toxin-antitoxin system|uniref:PilT protein domain protein n=1 Tax=Sphingopyxis granuli TaxID=267128 RepID=A0AA86GLR5_9SPHN|nr:type II toxin-antitoxin system VapC family toxin [Sphingopyxis granuli]AMG75314.1 PilT protein domain protein [Sphingopyxis granuli]QUM73958.1 type II toxin-antitoxin system VapC family toxin [Sphingopyxis granuli]UNK78742.1 type II toxin-antitoxin system VapC family toxin [Sphingopyxis granuli]